MNQFLVYCRIAFSLLIISSIFLIVVAEAAGIVGLNYGMLGDNLPTPNKVISLLKSKNITRVRLFAPNPDVLNALQGSGIELILGTLNQDIPMLATDPSFAQNWINTNIVPYVNNVKFRYIAVGNEVIPSDLAVHVLPAMKNLNSALKAAELVIPISTATSTSVLGTSFPPSRGEFSEELSEIMRSIIEFLETNKSPLLVNVYPYFAYINNLENISLDYAIFMANRVVVRDGKYKYKNLFDAITDSMYSALEKVGGDDVEIVISESGWPSAQNGDIATIANAKKYNNNLIAHVTGTYGTPKRPGKDIETYLFAIFNEDLKPAVTEQNFGLFYPNMTEVYHVNFSPNCIQHS